MTFAGHEILPVLAFSEMRGGAGRRWLGVPTSAAGGPCARGEGSRAEAPRLCRWRHLLCHTTVSRPTGKTSLAHACMLTWTCRAAHGRELDQCSLGAGTISQLLSLTQVGVSHTTEAFTRGCGSVGKPCPSHSAGAAGPQPESVKPRRRSRGSRRLFVLTSGCRCPRPWSRGLLCWVLW